MAARRRHMKRWEVAGARFITCSCYRRMQLMGRPELRDVFVESMVAAREKLGFRLIAWVAMPEHFHLIIDPRGRATVGQVLWHIKKPMADRVIARWRELRAPVLAKMVDAEGLTRYWLKGGGYDRNLRDEDELWEKVVYIHRNPVKRGLVQQPWEWKWSSARWYGGEREGEVPIDTISDRYRWTF